MRFWNIRNAYRKSGSDTERLVWPGAAVRAGPIAEEWMTESGRAMPVGAVIFEPL